MNLNVFNLSFRKSYYLRHPLRFLRECCYCVRDAYRRIRYGWTYSDVWNMYDWILETFPQMLRYMADKGCAYPGFEPFETPEKWHDWLHSVADVMDSFKDDNLQHNEWEEEYFNCPKNNELRELYLSRDRELTNQLQQLVENTFTELGRHFFELWD